MNQKKWGVDQSQRPKSQSDGTAACHIVVVVTDLIVEG
jgi:hypothetical protein